MEWAICIVRFAKDSRRPAHCGQLFEQTPLLGCDLRLKSGLTIRDREDNLDVYPEGRGDGRDLAQRQVLASRFDRRYVGLAHAHLACEPSLAHPETRPHVPKPLAGLSGDRAWRRLDHGTTYYNLEGYMTLISMPYTHGASADTHACCLGRKRYIHATGRAARVVAYTLY